MALSECDFALSRWFTKHTNTRKKPCIHTHTHQPHTYFIYYTWDFSELFDWINSYRSLAGTKFADRGLSRDPNEPEVYKPITVASRLLVMGRLDARDKYRANRGDAKGATRVVYSLPQCERYTCAVGHVCGCAAQVYIIRRLCVEFCWIHLMRIIRAIYNFWDVVDVWPYSLYLSEWIFPCIFSVKKAD